MQDPSLGRSLPEDVRVEWIRALPVRWARRVGVGSLSFRSWRYLARAGHELLRRDRFDLVCFSTTEFPLMALGPRWRRKYGVPYVLDFQDPWVNDYYALHPEVRPPGGRLKHGFAQWLARKLERRAVAGAGHVVCVSPDYPEMFMRRYNDMRPDQFTTLPFGALESDLVAARSPGVVQSAFDPNDGKEHWVYAGRGGSDMGFALRGFFSALRRAVDRDPALRGRLAIHFVGTDYAPAHMARKTVEPVAQECGVGDMVSEQPARLPYFEALRCLCDAHALVVPGSDDPGYTASKLYPYILARKPLLAIFHEKSTVVKVLRETRAGSVVTFGGRYGAEALCAEIGRVWFQHWPVPTPQTDWSAFEQYTAREMTRRFCDVFDKAMARWQQLGFRSEGPRMKPELTNKGERVS
ncbi:MAG: glycosyltransferase [Verrucomicrobiota bacterium]